MRDQQEGTTKAQSWITCDSDAVPYETAHFYSDAWAFAGRNGLLGQRRSARVLFGRSLGPRASWASAQRRCCRRCRRMPCAAKSGIIHFTRGAGSTPSPPCGQSQTSSTEAWASRAVANPVALARPNATLLVARAGSLALRQSRRLSWLMHRRYGSPGHGPSREVALAPDAQFRACCRPDPESAK